MKILHIVAGLEPGGGMAESVPSLCRFLQLAGHEVVLVTLEGTLSEAALAAAATGVNLVRLAPAWPRMIYFSWAMLWRLRGLCATADVVHVHSNWTFPVWWGCRCAQRARKKLVMSPRGCLDPVRLRHSAWKKRLVGRLDRYWLRHAAAVHVTSEKERAWVEVFLHPPSGHKSRSNARGGPQLVVVPNGVVLPEQAGARGHEAIKITDPDVPVRKKHNAHVVLYMGRLHPLKGLDLLLEAWSLACHDQGDAPNGAGGTWRLIIAGGDEQDTLQNLQRLAARLGISDGVDFMGPVYGAEKERLLADADLFVLPSHSENFGIVVAEALAAGVPVIATKGAPWRELEGYYAQGAGHNGSVKGGSPHEESYGRSGWWVEVSVAALAVALREALALSDGERRLMGENGRRLIAQKYRWEMIAAQMVAMYRT